MKAYDNTTRKEFELAPEGPHSAVCYRVVDIGRHKVTGKYPNNPDGTPKPPQAKVYFYFEIEEKMSDGRRFMVSESFNHLLEPKLPKGSSDVKARLRKFLKSWIGADPGGDFDVDDMLGKPALLNLVHSKSEDGEYTYVNIGSIMPLPKSMVPLTPENETFTFDPRDWSQINFEKLSENMREKIRTSLEYRKKFDPTPADLEHMGGTGSQDPGENLPF